MVSRHCGVDLDGIPKVLAEAVDDDPFEIVGFASIAASALQTDVGQLFDELAESDPRLGPVLWAVVASLPFIDHLAQSDLVVEEGLPPWLLHRLDDAAVTGMMHYAGTRRGRGATYLVEVTMRPELVTTCVFELQGDRQQELVGFHTVAASMSEVADFHMDKYGRDRENAYANIGIEEGTQALLMALDTSLHEGKSSRWRPPWPLNLPTAALVIELAVRRVPLTSDLPYVTARRHAPGTSEQAKKLRRSLGLGFPV